MSRILFDLSATQPIGNTKFHGGGIYGIILFKKMVSIESRALAVWYDDRKYIDEEIVELIKEHKIPTYFSRKIDMYEAARKESKVIYAPIFNTTYRKFPPPDISLIVTVHGLRDLEMPSDTYSKYIVSNQSGIFGHLKTIYRNLSHSKDHVRQKREEFFQLNNVRFITVSSHSKYAIHSFFPFVKVENIKVFYSPSTINKKIALNNNNYQNPFGKYYLLVSANRWLKNGIRAMQAFDEIFSSDKDFDGQVVVTGLKKWNEVSYPIKNKHRFVLLGYVDELTLKGLFHYAQFLCYPSLNEGFGYPPLEAMFEGCPVIASAITSIPEICGDAVLYFNPYSVSEIKTRINQMSNMEYRKLYIERGKLRQREIEKKQVEDLEKLALELIKCCD